MAWQNDVYVCAAEPGSADLDLAAWTDRLVAALEELINPKSFDNVPQVTFARAVPSGDPRSVEGSAILLVLLSPALFTDSACVDEIARFRAQAQCDGRTVEHTVLMAVAGKTFESGGNPDIDWLLGGGSRLPSSRGFTDADGNPPAPGDALAQPLIDALQSLGGEIRRKLSLLNSRRPRLAETAEETVPTDVPDPQPVTDAAKRQHVLVYLESASIEDCWANTRKALDALVQVNPAAWVAPTVDLKERIRRRAERRAFLLECKGLVLIRAHKDDKTDLQITEAQAARNELLDAGAAAPAWVLVDWVGGAAPAMQDWADLKRIPANTDDWPEQVRKGLDL